MNELPRVRRTTIRRHPERGVTEREQIDAVLDEGLVAHVGFLDDGAPVVIPVTYARVGDDVYLHGALSGRLLTSLSRVEHVCVTVTLLDGLVLARSAFNHSLNYRSVMIFGKPRVVSDRTEKENAMNALVEHVVPGRTDDTRGPSLAELGATAIVAVKLAEYSGKARSGPPIDAAGDVSSPYWAGVIPAGIAFGIPQPDDGSAGAPLPSYLRDYRR